MRSIRNKKGLPFLGAVACVVMMLGRAVASPGCDYLNGQPENAYNGCPNGGPGVCADVDPSMSTPVYPSNGQGVWYNKDDKITANWSPTANNSATMTLVNEQNDSSTTLSDSSGQINATVSPVGLFLGVSFKNTGTTSEFVQITCTLASQLSGYAITGPQLTECPANGTQCKFDTMGGQWTVPTVSYAAYDNSPAKESSSVWVGIGTGDGLGTLSGDGTFVRMGTEQDVDDQGNATYFAWYQLYPSDPVMLPPAQYPVQAGDVISAGPGCNGGPAFSCTDWEIIIDNHTQHWVFDQTYPYSSSELSAEWMVGSDITTNNAASLPQLGPVVFSAATIDAGIALELSNAANAISTSRGANSLTACGAYIYGADHVILYMGLGPSCASAPLAAYSHDLNCDGYGTSSGALAAARLRPG